MIQGRPKIMVVGSSNMDLVVRSPRIPIIGETILGGDFLMVPGGKGANQAVAAAKLGVEAYLAAKLGNDVFGSQSLANFQKVGVNTEYVTQTEDAPSGTALIIVDDNGDNAIVVAPGANQKLSSEDISRTQPNIEMFGAIVSQLEIPITTVEFTAELANKNNIPFILDPAPAPDEKLSEKLLRKVDILTPNETEAEMLTDIRITDEAAARKACGVLLKMGVKIVILTMGSKGFFLADNGKERFVPAMKVDAVDTTAAGDAFTGSLACFIAKGKTVFEAAILANYVAALSVMKRGAQPSMPTQDEVRHFMNRMKPVKKIEDISFTAKKGHEIYHIKL